MTKLMEWLFGLSVFVMLWAAMLSGEIVSLNSQQELHIFLLPIYLVVLLGIYAATVVLYRVFTFNSCESAAEELKKQITEAKADLRSKGFKFV